MGKHSDTRIHEALELLNEVANEEGEHLKEIIADRYESLKDSMSSLGESAQREARKVYAAGRERVTTAARAVDENVHEHPWAYIGGAAVTGLLLGFLLARDHRR